MECRHALLLMREYLAELGDQNPRVAIGEWVDDYLSLIPQHRWPALVAADELLQHKVVAEHLSARADQMYYRDPHAGLMYAMSATMIYEVLAASVHKVAAEARAAAWREQASFMLRCGRLGEYELAITRAYEFTDDAADPEYERAVLDLSRAIALSEPDVGQPAEAIALLVSCTAVLASRGDVRRARIGMLRQGDALMATAEIERAAAIFRRLLVDATDSERPHVVLRLAWCAKEVGEYATALVLAGEARASFDRRGELAMRATIDWLIGEALSGMSELDEALSTLEKAEQDLSSLGMKNVWVAVRLTRAAVTLAADPTADIRELCGEAAAVSVHLDMREPSRRHHCTADALEFLRQNALRHIGTF
jgi:tetratricopeptide (TPR) repeat protein